MKIPVGMKVLPICVSRPVFIVVMALAGLTASPFQILARPRADSSCKATNTNHDKNCSISCPSGQSASCSDATGSNPPDCHCESGQVTTNSNVQIQLGKPTGISPSGPGPYGPPFLWTEVPGATRYKIVLNIPSYSCPPPPNGGTTTSAAGTEIAYAKASMLCSHNRCGFTAKYDRSTYYYPAGSIEGQIPPIRCPRNYPNPSVVTFSWTVQALAGNSAGPVSDPLSYTFEEAPPKPPAPPPTQPKYVVTCVFNTVGNYWAWYNGEYSPMIDIWGQVNPNVKGQSFTFASAPFQNCNGLVTGATPVGEAKFVVNSVALCTNLVNGSQETFINLACPKNGDSPTSYKNAHPQN